MNYRPEIDGLRAIAISLVVFNHLEFLGLNGGFIGVDIFFVISGFLISQILIKSPIDLNSLSKFYLRRIRRILPLLLIVLFTTSICVFFIFLPNEISSYSKSQLATLLFGSNFYFISNQGYFDASALSQPLLHTWSLGVEEQFYLLFPLVLLVLYRSKAISRLLSGIFLVGSLILCEIMLSENSTKVFYATYTRAWELILGALGGIWIHKSRSSQRPIGQKRVLSYGAILIIIYSSFSFSESTRLPGLLTLLPTLSTLTLLLLLNKELTFLYRFLTNRILVYLGKISFGIYLWHWPILVLVKHGELGSLELFKRVAILITSISLAALSNKFIEAPARDPLKISDKKIVSIISIAIILISLISLLGFVSRGFESYKINTMSASKLKTYEAVKDDWVDNSKCIFNTVSVTDQKFLSRFNACYKRLGKAVLVLGDSHAQEVFNALALNLNDEFLLGITRGGCRPHSPLKECQYEEYLAFQEIHESMIKTVIFHQAGFYLLNDLAGKEGDRSLFSTIMRVKGLPIYPVNWNFLSKDLDYLKTLSGAIPIIWLGPYVEPHYNVLDLVSHSEACSQNIYQIPSNQIITFENLDRELGNFLQQDGTIQYLPLVSALNFNWSKDLFDCYSVYWSDGDHWSKQGEARFGSRIVRLLKSKKIFD